MFGELFDGLILFHLAAWVLSCLATPGQTLDFSSMRYIIIMRMMCRANFCNERTTRMLFIFDYIHETLCKLWGQPSRTWNRSSID